MSTIPELTTDALWDLLATSGKGVLATIKRDGRPQLSNVSYAFDPSTRMLTTTAATFRTKTKNLVRDPRASIHVTSADFLLWVVAEGSVTLGEPIRSHDEPAAQEKIASLQVAHPKWSAEDLAAHLESYPIVDRLTITLHVDRIYGGNSTKALGIAEEVTPSPGH
jgi:PPOX class probable F420-dependent enzyme